MIDGVHHVAYVVADIDKAMKIFTDALQLKLLRRDVLPEFEMALFMAGDTLIELMRPIKEGSEVMEFYKRNGEGLFHIAYSTSDVEHVAKIVNEFGLDVGAPRIADTGWNVTQIDRNNMFGMRLEFAQPNKEHDVRGTFARKANG